MGNTGGALRADAARNRTALLEAARVTFGRRGLDAPLDEIARKAGIGNATLYRHYPNREALVAAVYAEAMVEVVAACERAVEAEDPWEGFSGHIQFVCGLQAENRGLADLLTRRNDGVPGMEQLRGRAYALFGQVADRAIAAGVLRHDFEVEDLPVILMANAGLIQRTADTAPDAWARFVHFVLDGLRQDGTRTPAPLSPGLPAVRAALAATPSEAAASAADGTAPH